MLVEKLKEHRLLIIESFSQAMEFKAFTDLSYIFATTLVEKYEQNLNLTLQHSIYGSATGMSDKKVTSADLPTHFSSAKNKYFFSLVHQQQVSLFENLFFDLLRILLLDRPERLSKKKQIEYEAIFSSQTKEEIIWKLVDRELNEIKYKNVTEWFEYITKAIGLAEIELEKSEKIAEAKATRDILVHNAGIVNQIYVNKSGSAARFKNGQMINVSGDYTRDTWIVFVEVLVTITDSLIQKFDEKKV